ncbi:MAG TPA: TIM-barrel domain-containing protein, partial [Rhodanobacteraceae bacterium]|nr:TIM-barrel domain-containing protein [Rhodanobacteraceae bacterium]
MSRAAWVRWGLCGLLIGAVMPVAAQSGGFDIPADHGHVRVELAATNIVHVSYRDDAAASLHATSVIDPGFLHRVRYAGAVVRMGERLELRSPALRVTWNPATDTLAIDSTDGRRLLAQHAPTSMRHAEFAFTHAADDALYGIGSDDPGEATPAGLLRRGTWKAQAGQQGHAGSPWVWSSAGYGLLLDSFGGRFELDGATLRATPAADAPRDYYVIVGTPPTLFAGLARISGGAPMFPKWSLGFLNSQWGIDQRELLQIVDGYRRRHIPLDGVILDFDWKAWGEGDYGEFRWNEAKFPDGANGKLKAMLDRRGVHLAGIMKPRIHVDTVEGRYASAHDLWLASSTVAPDYFSHKPVRDIDFDKPAARRWYFNAALRHSFRTGIAGWWNDEADASGDDSQFFNMQRALYDGQRRISDQRVWSLNRNFMLGAQRYAYGLWSGDIESGFASMAAERARMLSAINVGAAKWGMDGGGYKSRPSDENYARWIQFGAFTPIFRVHGSLGERRQPWLYGKQAERAASAAIRLRYSLLPYIYAYERATLSAGIGVVRPLPFAFPADARVRDAVDSWMFGDWLLVSPVVEQGQTRKSIYLPAGHWIDWWSGQRHAGEQMVELTIDNRQWSDIPLFIRSGAIIPQQPPMDYVSQQPLHELAVAVFP